MTKNQETIELFRAHLLKKKMLHSQANHTFLLGTAKVEY
jgi:hypothetical protein